MERISINYSYIDYADDPQDREAIELRTIFVSPYERRNGIGTELVEKLKEIAGKKNITTYVDTDPLEGFGKFLIDIGFRRVEGQSNYGGKWELKNGIQTRRVEKQKRVGNLLGHKKAPSPKRRSLFNRKKAK